MRQRESHASEDALREERKLYANARVEMEQAHEREIKALKTLLDEERKHSQESLAQFEKGL